MLEEELDCAQPRRSPGDHRQRETGSASWGTEKGGTSGWCQMVKGCEAMLRGMDCVVLRGKFQHWYWPSIMMDVVDPNASLCFSGSSLDSESAAAHLCQYRLQPVSLKVSTQLWLPTRRAPESRVLGSTSVSWGGARGNRPGRWDQTPWAPSP